MIQRYDFNISGKNLGLVFIPNFVDNFSKKKFLHVTCYIQLKKIQCLIAFTS